MRAGPPRTNPHPARDALSMTRKRAARPAPARAALAGGLLATLALCAPGQDALAGAWLRADDSYYFKLSASRLYTESEYDYTGDKVDILSGENLLVDASYRDVSVSAYLEYGLADRLTLIASLPFKVLRARRTELADTAPDIRRRVDATNGGFSDATVALKTSLLVDPFPVAVQGGLRFPLGYDSSPDNGGPPLGSGHVDVEGHLLAGMSLYPVPAYAAGSIGYRIRTGDLADEILFNVEAGARMRRLGLKIGLDGLYSTTPPPDLAAAGADGGSAAVVVTNQDVLKLTPALAWLASDEISFVVEAFSVIDGRNTVAGTTISAGVVFEQ